MSAVDPADALRADIAVVGLGPVGLVLCALLAARGARVVGIDPLLEPFAAPRAIAVDDETLRTLIGLPAVRGDDSLFNTAQRVEVRDGRGRVLTALAFDGGVHGVPGLSFFHQPSLERALRRGLQGFPDVELRYGQRVAELREVDAGVAVALVGPGPATVHASWVVGCDGASSLVRQQRGIGYGGRTFSEAWVVIDVDTSEPLPHLPYFSYVMDRRRPAVNGPRPGGHRFEFMLLPGESREQMASPAQVNRWLEPYLGASSPAPRVQTRIVRCVVYDFHARIAERWRDGRVLLAGDAAHSMPPFGGQGLAAGVGDAMALAWRLDEVRRGLAAPALLDGYARDRRPRVAEMITTAKNAGRLLTATSAPAAALGRLTVRALDRSPVLGPRWRSGAIRGPATVNVPRPERRFGGGAPLPNPRVRRPDGRVMRLDDVLAKNWALIARGADPRESVAPPLRDALLQRGAQLLAVVPAGALADAAGCDCPVVEDLDGWLLRLWNAHPWRRRDANRHHPPADAVALIRPDRFVAAVGPSAALQAAFERLTRCTLG